MYTDSTPTSQQTYIHTHHTTIMHNRLARNLTTRFGYVFDRHAVVDQHTILVVIEYTHIPDWRRWVGRVWYPCDTPEDLVRTTAIQYNVKMQLSEEARGYFTSYQAMFSIRGSLMRTSKMQQRARRRAYLPGSWGC